MSMLAEPKRKVKWSLNPRGALWSNDENKFGQKLMEKMGWQKGKGLGKGQDGMQDPLKVPLKSDMKGVGFKENGEAGVDHFEAFEDVLTNLNKLNNPEAAQDNGSPSSTNAKVDANKESRSLESKSKGSMARVHYHKFTRGKDLSQYNEDDLACILGSKMSKIRKEKEKVEADELEDKSPPEEVDTEIGRVDTSYGLTTHYGGNFKDYFAKKMLEMKQKRTEGIIGGGSFCTNGTESGMNDSSFPDFDFDPERSTFSFNVTAEVVEEVADAKEITSDNLNVSKVSKSKKNKKKKKEADEENENEWKNEREKKKIKKEMKRKLIAQQALESEKENEYLNLKEYEVKESEPTEAKKKKKSKRKEDEVVETEIASKKKSKRKENEIESEIIDVQKVKSKRKNDKIEETEVTHKKKSKRKEKNVEVCEVPELTKKKSKKREDKVVEEIEVPEEINQKKKKKKSKVKENEEVVSTEVVVEENNKRKKKKLKMKMINIENNEDEIVHKKKKKSKHSIQEVEESNQNEVNEKKKRKRNEKVIERIENDENEMTEMCVEPIKEMNESYCTANSYDEESTSDKKKKKRKEKEENEKTTKEDKSLQPFKKLKKLTSDLNLFKSNNLENEDQSEQTSKENEDQSEQTSKPKLSAMNSFKMLKSDIEDKLKFKKIKKSKSKLKIVEENSADSGEPSEGAPTRVEESIRREKEMVTLSIPYKGVTSRVTVDLQELFPGSNLYDVGPYEQCFS